MADRLPSMCSSLVPSRCHVVAVCLLAAVCLGAATATGRAAEDPRLLDFLQKFEPLRDRRNAGAILPSSEWLGFGAPWGPYVGRVFANGLSDSDLDRHRAAQDKRDCGMVVALERRGFLALYPFLAEALAREDVARSFETVVLRLSNAAPGFTRCKALTRLDRARAKLEKAGVALKPVDIRTYITSSPPIIKETIRVKKDLQKKGIRTEDLKLPPENELDLEICTNLHALSDLAVEQAYAPALGDILQFLVRPRWLIHTKEAEYYLLVLASRSGLTASSLHERRSSLRLELGQRRRTRIEAAVAKRETHGVTWPYIYCRHLDLMTRLKASRGTDE